MRYLVPYFIENLLQDLDSSDHDYFYKLKFSTYPKTYDGKVEAWKNLILNYDRFMNTLPREKQPRYDVDLLPDFTVRIYDVAVNKELRYSPNEKLCTDTISSTTHIGIILRDRKLNYHIQIRLRKDLEIVHEFMMEYTEKQNFKFSFFNENMIICYSTSNTRFISFIEIPSGKVIFSHKIEEESTELHRLNSLTHNHYYIQQSGNDSYMDLNNAIEVKIQLKDLIHKTSIDHQTVDVKGQAINTKLLIIKCNLSCDDLILRWTLFEDFCTEPKLELKILDDASDVKFPYLTFLKWNRSQTQWDCVYHDLLTNHLETFFHCDKESTQTSFFSQELGIINDDKYQIFCLATNIHDPKFPNSDNVLRIFDLNSRKLIFEQGLKFVLEDGETTDFRYDYDEELLLVIGYEGPNYFVDLKTMKLIDYEEEDERHFGNSVQSNTYFLKDSVFFVWIDDHLFPLSKEIEDGIEKGWAQLDSD